MLVAAYRGTLTSLHIPCADEWDWKDLNSRATCQGSVGCVAGQEYCSYNDNTGYHLNPMGTPCQASDIPIYMTGGDDDDGTTHSHSRSTTKTPASATTTA